MNYKSLLLLFLLQCCVIGWVSAQVPPTRQQQRPPAMPPEEVDVELQQPRRGLLDDSTKQVYGPRTTLYFYEHLLRNNRFEKYEIDTSLTGFHNYEPVARTWYKYQDLGNIGSASQPVFYDVPDQIGRTSGFHVYDLHYRSPENMKYYDTKSPYTNLAAFFGGGNRNMLDITFTRNINPRWNVGFNFHTIRARKVLNPARRDDNMVDQNTYSLQTSYRSENEKYILLANFSRMRHLVNEQGGIIPTSIDSTSLYFTYEDSKVWLRNSRAVDLRQDYHLYHQYELLKGWQVYHVFDKKKQEVSFFSNLNSPDSLFFNLYAPPAQMDTTNNVNHFSEWRNEMGFKGDLGPIYYNAYVKFRTGRMANPLFVSNNNFNELYLGGQLRGQLSERWYFEADGEYLIPQGFRIRGLFRSPYLDLTYTKALYRPTLAQELYVGNHYDWNNNFSNIGVDQVKGELKADFAKFSLRPSLTINRVNNYVVFNRDQKPEQIDAEAFMVIPGVRANFAFGNLSMQNEVIYTAVTGGGADAFRIPELFINSRIFFDSPLFDENIFVQIGVEARYRSDYFAHAYMPATQQFYLQDRFSVHGYPVLDAFLNFRINRTRLLLRYNHLNQNMLSQPGYFVTPDYTGLKGMLDVGINWSFFD